MKKILLSLLVMLALAIPVKSAHAEFYRVILDVPFENANHALALMNLLENNKDKVMAETTLAGYVASAKMVKSWDSEIVDEPEFTLLRIDFAGIVVTHTLPDLTASQELVNEATKRRDYLQAKVDALNTKITTLQAEIDAQQP